MLQCNVEVVDTCIYNLNLDQKKEGVIPVLQINNSTMIYIVLSISVFSTVARVSAHVFMILTSQKRGGVLQITTLTRPTSFCLFPFFG